MPSLTHLQAQFQHKSDALYAALKAAEQPDGSYDLLRAPLFQGCRTDAEAMAALKAHEAEIDDLCAQVKCQQAIADRASELVERKRIDTPMVHPGLSGSAGVPGDLITQVKVAWPRGRRPDARGVWLDQDFTVDVKALMTTSAGWAPQATRLPRVIEFAHRPVQVTDLFPIAATDNYELRWMEETTATYTNVAEIAEGGTYGEITEVFTQRTSAIRKIGGFIRVTDEQLADVDQVAALLDQRLRFATMQRFDFQILNGDGIGVNLLGILNTSGVQTQAKGADPEPDAIYKAMDKVRVTGRAVPSAVIMHPNDWATIRLLRGSNDTYLWGSPSQAGPQTIWGVPVALSDAIVENTALVGDFTNFAQLFVKQQVQVLAGYTGTDFIEGKQVLRVDFRAGLAVLRPSAFCLVTGL
jgi:HK97 family phage major capsid protein